MNESAGLFPTPTNPDFPFVQIYKPLSVDRKEIRLVEIAPGDVNEVISLKLVHGCFLADDRHLPYQALSYCAGDPKDTQIVMFHGYPFRIFNSLFEAISRLRADGDTDHTMLFIDQICIQQHDVVEKGSQVMMMKEVYEKASCVLSWLGNPSPDPDLASPFDLVADFWSLYGEVIEPMAKCLIVSEVSDKELMKQLLIPLRFGDEVAVEISSEDVHSIMKCWNFFADIKAIKDFGRKARALCELLRRPYWSRKWILQEMVAAEDAILICGVHRQRAWDLFATYGLLGAKFVWEMNRKANSIWGPNKALGGKSIDPCLESIIHIMEVDQMVAFVNFWVYVQIPHESSLVGALALSRNVNASDPRDKLYSLLSIVGRQELDRYGIQPDYSSKNPPSAVIVTFSELYVASGSGSKEFSLFWANGAYSKYDIPSWCFDFTLAGSEQPGEGTTPQPRPKAKDPVATVERVNNFPYLKTRGKFLGVIQKCSSTVCPDTGTWRSDPTRTMTKHPQILLQNWLAVSRDLIATKDLSLLAAVTQLLNKIGETMPNLRKEVRATAQQGDDDKGIASSVETLLSLFEAVRSPFYRWHLAIFSQANEVQGDEVRVQRVAPVSKYAGLGDMGILMQTIEDYTPPHLSPATKPGRPAGFLGIVQGPAEAGDQVFRQDGEGLIFVLRSQQRKLGGVDVYKLVGMYEFDTSELDNLLKAAQTVEVAIA